MANKITEKDVVTVLSDTDQMLGVFGGKTGRIRIPDLRSQLNANDNQVLNDLAFYIDVNKASANGATRVDTGGNSNMRTLWEDAGVDILMDASGNYCELNQSDARYTAEGEAVVDLTAGTVLAKWANCDFMHIIPLTYGRVQTVQVGAVTVQRLWLSLVPLPGGFIIPQQVVGKFKGYNKDGKYRSLPGTVPTASTTINGFWNLAQARSKNHGLPNMDFRNHLLFHMMSKYGYRDSQNCKSADGTLVWGVGLDGTESLTDGFTRQYQIKTGATLSLGRFDGKVAVTDSVSNTCHSVNVNGFENTCGQYWEMAQGLCSVGTDVYCWRSNVMPTGTPTADTFKNIDHVLLQRNAADTDNPLMNIVTSEQGQGVYMIPGSTVSGISYGDHFYYNTSGQLWLFGGSSYDGSYCGLASAYSFPSWSYSSSSFAARLAYYGSLNKVTSARLAELAA